MNEKSILELWADPYISCEDISKCGQCLKQHILSEVAKEMLQSKDEFTKEDVLAVNDESTRQWQETPLYARVQGLMKEMSLDEVRLKLEKEGIQI